MSLIFGAELNTLIAANAAAIAPHFVNIKGRDSRVNPEIFGDIEDSQDMRWTSSFRMGKFPVTLGEQRELVDRLGANRFALLAGSGGSKPKVWALGDSEEVLTGTPVQKFLNGETVGDLLAGGLPIVLNELKIVEVPAAAVSQSEDPLQPLVNVDWFESVVHSLLRGALLATEAQWEYAVRGGKHENTEAIPHYPSRTTLKVGSRCPNKFGLHDMIGNVWEWNMNWHYLHSFQFPDERLGPVIGRQRIIRGGLLSDYADYLGAFSRYCADPKERSDHTGFRLVAPPALEQTPV